MTQEIVRSDIDSATHLSHFTRVTLLSRVKRLYETQPFPKKIVSVVLSQISDRDSTKLAYIQAILSVMKLSPAFRTLVGESQRTTLVKEAMVLKHKEGERRSNGELRESDIAWEQLLACEESFPSRGEDLLLHRLYTHLPTLRSDYTPVKIVKTRQEADDPGMNYFVMDESPFFILQEYKTAGRYGRQEYPLPKSIVDLVPTHQEYLFESSPGKPVLPNTLSKKVTRAYQKHCGLSLNINALRRAYALHTKQTDGTDVDAAIAQGHSLTTHHQYASRG